MFNTASLIYDFFLWLQVNIVLGRTARGGGIDIIVGILIELLIFKIIYSFTVVFGSCVFNITFYKDKFKFKNLFRDKTFNYSEVSSITEISPLTGYIQNRKAKICIIEIKFKNGKTMHILINSPANEYQEELKRECVKNMKMPIELTFRSLFSIK